MHHNTAKTSQVACLWCDV